MTAIEIPTPHGPAVAHLRRAATDPVGALVLGHGAGGGVAAPDLVAVTEVAVSLGFVVVLVEQPYRVAGRRSPAPAQHLDTAWTAVIEHLLDGELSGLGIVAGGRSSGARVACRTAERTGAAGVLCLAFPLRPPARKGRAPAPGRLPELKAVRVPVLIVQGQSDPFGMPPVAPGREVIRVRGNHSLRSDRRALVDAVTVWLPRVLPGR